jgi:hypothetical protein
MKLRYSVPRNTGIPHAGAQAPSNVKVKIANLPCNDLSIRLV